MGGRKARKRAQRRTRAGAGGAPGKGRSGDSAATVESHRGNQRGRQPAQRDGDRATATTGAGRATTPRRSTRTGV